MDSISIIISSGLVSLLVTFCTILFVSGKYKQKIDTVGAMVTKHEDKISNLSERISRISIEIRRLLEATRVK